MARCSMFDTDCREQMLARLHRLTPESRRRRGRMSAPQMIAHLSDQMRHALGDVPVALGLVSFVGPSEICIHLPAPVAQRAYQGAARGVRNAALNVGN